MKTPDDFTDWIKKRLEENPAEPPAGSWESIAESLDLEGAWEGINQDLDMDGLWQTIDQRLLVAERVLWWDKAASAATGMAAMLLLALPLWLQLQAPDTPLLTDQQSRQQLTQGGASAGQSLFEQLGTAPVVETTPRTAATPSATAATEDQAQGASAAFSKGIAEAQAVLPVTPFKEHETKGVAPANQQPTTPFVAQQHTSAQNGTNKPAKAEDSAAYATNQLSAAQGNAEASAGSFSALPAASRQEASLALAKGILPIPTALLHVGKSEAEASVVRQKQAANWRVGLGGTGRLSYLLNNKTFHAMDKSSLTTSLPGLRKSFSLQAERPLSSSFLFVGDLAVHNEAGQRYQEYQGGMYGTTDTRLRYSQLQLMLAYSPKKQAFGLTPYTRWLVGLSGGWLHQARLAGPMGITDLTGDYRKHSAGLLVGVEYMIPLSSQLWMGYGLRSYVDLLNIYAGNEEVPAQFRRTRSSALDFTLTFKYEIRNK